MTIIRKSGLIGSVLVLATGCRNAERSATAPDNTANNSPSALTAEQQSNAKADVDLTASIRRALVSDDSFSTNAKNIKIIASNGVVTLRGPVSTPSEKDRVQAKVVAIAGSNRVVNELSLLNSDSHEQRTGEN